MSIYDTLNEQQKQGVFTTEGPVLILAGAGSGKTRVLTHRIAYLIDEQGVNPWNILAITFTNKAASEMRERVDKVVSMGAEHVWVSTFHSMCVRILRRYIDRIGYDTNFTIYDSDDQKSIVREAIKKLNIDSKTFKERAVLSAISAAKDNLESPQDMREAAGSDYNLSTIARIYDEYQRVLKINNALDFDDLIVKTVELFLTDDDVLEYYQDRFRYIMVDEYQDTNTAQFRLVSILAGKYKNLCVVGDDDQSIYKFRGANIHNILNFEDAFPGATVIKLEQNYRSTQNILNAANNVIANNIGRKQKTLWTDNGDGEKVHFTTYDDAYAESYGVASTISAKVTDGWNYNDCAILYRTNAQSRALEEKLVQSNIPYKIYGGVNFYQRKEIKDILAYLKTIDNGKDSQAVKRIINVPKRGIGATTINKVQEYADERGISFFDALMRADEITTLGRSASKLKPFITYICALRAKVQSLSLEQLVEDMLEEIRYREYLLDGDTPEEVAAREENIDELINKIVTYEEECEDDKPTLSGFLEEVALVADIDNLDENSNHVMLMTIHSAKGLEFPIVFMTGMEDGLFPSYMSIVSEDRDALEEERRLCYVGITRAKKELYLSSARIRMVRGETQYNKVSRFIKEIPDELMAVSGETNFDKRKEKAEEPKPAHSRRAASFMSTAYSSAMGSYISNASNAKPNTKVGFGREFSSDIFDIEKKKGLSYGVGDRVLHARFGMGTVAGIVEGARDYEVSVDFDEFGRKKLLAGFAKLKKS